VLEKVKYESLILRWNPNTGTFSLKKRVPPKQRTIEQYLREAGRWVAAC
jgi:hypothetical protein